MKLPSNKSACEHRSLLIELETQKIGAPFLSIYSKVRALTMKFVSILNSNWICARVYKIQQIAPSAGFPLAAKRNFWNRLVMSSVFSLSRHKDGAATQQFLIIYGPGCLGAGDRRTGTGKHVATLGWWLLNVFFGSSPWNIHFDLVRYGAILPSPEVIKYKISLEQRRQRTLKYLATPGPVYWEHSSGWWRDRAL